MRMAKLMGRWPTQRAPGLLSRLTAWVSETARLQVEAATGEGFRRLEPYVAALPDSVTLLRGPVLGFSMSVDGCLLGPGRVVVFNVLHWKGPIGQSEKGGWTGAGGRVDLGRPDRRAALFADRLRFSGLAGSLDVEPILILTGGPIQYSGTEPEAVLVPLVEFPAYAATAFQPDGPACSYMRLIHTLLT
jgi:hypothetical protein